jgi:branched-chain amino acid transport system ATP-binding protein
MAEPLLRVIRISKRFGGLLAIDQASLTAQACRITALIGPNGAGKTTLINQISGLTTADSGRIIFHGRGVTALPMHERARLGLVRSFQITSILPWFSALENVALAVQARSGSSFRFFGDASAEKSLNERAMNFLTRFGLAGRAEVAAGLMSHGEKRQLELAIALASEPKLLLLDEPLAGTSHDESQALIATLQELRRELPIVLVEHDMDAVFALADRISVLVYGRIIASGSPQSVRDNAEVRQAYLGEEA